jgi:hypothetical protein
MTATLSSYYHCRIRRKADLIASIALSAFLLMSAARAHGGSPSILTGAFSDLAEVKKKAEAGDAQAQVDLADTLWAKFRPAEALDWYRKAAAQGSIKAAYRIGDMLLYGAVGIPQTLTVQPNHTEGIRWTFQAATNRYPEAYYNMAKALREGLGTSTNLVEAYAWLMLSADTPGGSIVSRVQMNELVLKLDTAAIERAQSLAAEFKAGNWRAPVTRVIPEGDSRLKLNGITLGTKQAVALVNGKVLSEGEIAAVSIKSGMLTIKCLKIEKDSVLISVEGEDTPRLLHLR